APGNTNINEEAYTQYCRSSASAGAVVGCGDNRGWLINEYNNPNYSADFVPGCADFTQSGSTYFAFTEYNTSDIQRNEFPDWAIVRGSLSSGADCARSNYGGPLNINSAYRSPATNNAIDPSAPGSRHIHGDAVDLATDATTWDAVASAGAGEGAGCGSPCLEPRADTFPGHVHFDWRNAAGVSCPAGW